MEVVDAVYDLLKNDNSVDTIRNNFDLFQTFYFRYMNMKYNGPHVIDIYKYLISLDLTEFEDELPYLASNIFEDFNRHIIDITQGVYSRNVKADDSYVELLFGLIDDYYYFKQYENKGKYNKLKSENAFIRDCTGAMIIVLNSSFFNFSNENINRMLEYIKDNKYLLSIIESGKRGDNLADKDYIFQYTSRYLFNSAFISEENIKNDAFLKAFKEGKIRDFDTIRRIIKNTSIYYLDYCFEEGLKSFVDILDKSISDEAEKFMLFSSFFYKLVDMEQYEYILTFIMHDDRSKKYISNKDKVNIMEKLVFSYPTNLSKEEIEYILKYVDNSLFLINLKENLKSNDWNKETRSYVENLTKDVFDCEVDFNTAVIILDNLLKEKEHVNIFLVFAALKAIIRNVLDDDSICIYLIDDDSIHGCANEQDNTIKLSYSTLSNLVNGHNFDLEPELLHILNTIFHESRHIVQFRKMKSLDMDPEIMEMYKEKVVTDIAEGFYTKNYVGISYEKDARVFGADLLCTFLQTCFPYMKNSIAYYDELATKESERHFEEKHLFELSDELSIDEILSKIISINPDILKEYPYLSREFNLDGTKKVGPVLT